MRAQHQQPQHQQRGGDRPADVPFGDVHGLASVFASAGGRSPSRPRRRRRHDLHPRAVGQAILALDRHRLAGGDAAQDDGDAVLGAGELEGAPLGGAVGLDRHRRSSRWLCITVRCGTVTTSLRSTSSRRTLTNSPGHSFWSALGKTALMRSVPVEVSIWLSITETSPRPSSTWASSPSAITVSGPAACSSRTWSLTFCGTVKLTKIGFTWVMLTRLVACAAWTRLPISTRRVPVRPSKGARMSA